MKCPNCKKDISEDSLFCEHCGQKAEKKKEDKKPDEVFEDSNKIKKNILDHLEFMGYEITVTDPIGRYLGKHQSKPILNITIGNGVSITTFYKVDTKKIEKSRSKALELLNKMNNTSSISSFSLTINNESLVCATWYPSIYSKKTFADFMDLFENDIRRALQIDGVMDIFA